MPTQLNMSVREVVKFSSNFLKSGCRMFLHQLGSIQEPQNASFIIIAPNYGRKGIGDEELELPIGILQDDTGQVVGNERTHNNNTRQQQHNNQAKERS